MAGGLAHDFNNLLAVVVGNAALAAEHPGLPPDLAPRLRDVMTAAERGTELVSQLLAYSGRGRFVHATEIDPAELVSAACASASLPENVTLNLDLTGDLPKVSGDPHLLLSLISNLVLNAVEAIGDAPGVVRISARLEHLAERRRLASTQELEPGNYLCLYIQDTGPGIPEHLVPRIFEPFFSTRFLGRGMGLSAALGIARRHGGAIHVESKPGRGTVFQVFSTHQKLKPRAGFPGLHSEGLAMGGVSSPGMLSVEFTMALFRPVCLVV